MNTLVAEPVVSDAIDVRVSNEELVVFLLDGRTISIPLEWYPRLLHASEEERLEWELIGGGEGIHWPQNLSGRPSSGIVALEACARVFLRYVVKTKLPGLKNIDFMLLMLHIYIIV